MKGTTCSALTSRYIRSNNASYTLKYIFEEFEGSKGVKSVSGLGLMIGIETEKDAKEIVNACMQKGVLILTAKTKVRLLPPLNIPFESFIGFPSLSYNT